MYIQILGLARPLPLTIRSEGHQTSMEELANVPPQTHFTSTLICCRSNRISEVTRNISESA